MLAFPDMLLGPAEQAGMKIPADAENFDKNEFPHFAVYLTVQLGAPMPYPTAHWDNAKVIAAIPDDQIKTVTFEKLQELGVAVGSSSAWA